MSAFREGVEGVVRTAALILWTRATMVEAGMRQASRWGGTAQFYVLHGEIRGYIRLASARFIPSPKDLVEICAVGFRGIELAWRRLITASDVVARPDPATIGLSVASSHSRCDLEFLPAASSSSAQICTVFLILHDTAQRVQQLVRAAGR